MIRLAYRFEPQGDVTVEYLSSKDADKKAKEVIKKGACYHSMKGCWDANLKQHVKHEDDLQ